MTACEKCWRDAGGDPERYRTLVEERRDNPCTPEEMAGPDATLCPWCGHMTVHQFAHICMRRTCNYEAPRPVRYPTTEDNRDG